jgi:hypothetical protein
LLFPRAALQRGTLGIRRLLAAGLCAAAIFVRPAFAEDPPSRVASLNYLSGEVTYALHEQPGEPGPSDAESWLKADFNQPVCEDMSLRTGSNARARVRIGPDAIEMSDNTSLNLLNLTYDQIEASLTQGRVYVHLSRLDPAESVEFETPRGSVWVLQAGAYDIDIGVGDQPTRIIVFEGKARFVGGSADLAISAGRQALVSGTYPSLASAESDWTGINPTQAGASPAPVPEGLTNSPSSTPRGTTALPTSEAISASGGEQPRSAAANPLPPIEHPASPAAEAAAQPASQNRPEPTPLDKSQARMTEASAATGKLENTTAGADQKSSDQFLTWVEESDQEQGPQPPQHSTRYVSAETTGADALDRYGHWETLPDSEPVWFPTSVPSDWAPYRFGHWDWIKPWGWTWIDDQPWGFAPFHYGRWVNLDGRWGWLPGAVEPQPVYAPALVAFIDTPDGPGGGPDAGPGVGWFPLGPGDDYSPWYGAGRAYITAVNAPVHWHPDAARTFAERNREMWRAQYFNRRFATVVSREAFAGERRIDRAMVRQLDAGRLDRLAVMRGAPHLPPPTMHAAAGPEEFRGEPRGMTPAAPAAGLHARSGGAPAVERGPGTIGHSPGVGQSGRAEAARAAAGENGRGAIGRFARSQASAGSFAGYRGAGEQFQRPQISGNPGFHGAAQPQFARPQISGYPGFRGAPQQQFARPQIAQGFRGGFQQFGRPQGFQTPVASVRGGMIGRAAPVMHPAASAAIGGRHK